MVVRLEHLAVAFPVLRRLATIGGILSLLTGAFCLDDAACRDDASKRVIAADAKLIVGEQPAIRQTGAPVARVDSAFHLRPHPQRSPPGGRHDVWWTLRYYIRRVLSRCPA